MSKKIKPNESESTLEKVYTSYESKSALNNAEVKKKKPILERLGLVEPITDLDENSQLSPYESELVMALDSKIKPTTEDSEIINMEQKNNSNKLSINEIFAKFQLESDHTNTIYLIERFIKALPENLPADVKRQSIINIISASQLDVNALLKDGNHRVSILKKYSQDFSNTMDEIISSNNKEISKLQEKIAYYNKVNSEKQQVKEEQKSIVDFEIQKLSNIIEFVENKAK